MTDTTIRQAPYADLSAPEFKKQLEQTPGAVLLDVRTAGEVAQRALPGALNLDVLDHTFREQVATLDRTAPYFVYCQSGNRSAGACQYLAREGFTSITNLAGGLMAWPY
jgi:rhodanese-related sulfurtransferase